MTRNAPLLTLLAVGVLGGGLFATNHLAAPPAGDAVRVAESATAPGPPAAAPRIGTIPAPGVVGVVPDPAAAAGADRDAGARPDEIAYAGRTEGRPMTVAVVVTGDEAVAYVCDARDEVWLRGTATGGELDLRSADGSATLTGTADADGATGTFTLDGVEWALTAEATDVDAAVAAGRDDVADVADRAGMAY
ncbi:hypothetical protein GCM10017691_28570 [Pseudonocardia petroleophila]|uniref:Uncharacterized protein n=1 Tax=Pseudonocardia petroleophila TaxID=37331 RepID=A0A7G7MEQ0_9PSEU|nr:hypothetical protein [Pseudonocardia petroleophila]QNG51261.1 hypothetical protein H6H00_24410 [Pseudonocardia petroleophila]